MFLLSKGTTEQSVPSKIAVKEQYVNICKKKNNQVSHCTWEKDKKVLKI